MNESAEDCAKRLFIECYPNWLNNGLVVKKSVAKEYATLIATNIIKEYVNDLNNPKIDFWNTVIIFLKII